jgi:hypothetical protein
MLTRGKDVKGLHRMFRSDTGVVLVLVIKIVLVLVKDCIGAIDRVIMLIKIVLVLVKDCIGAIDRVIMLITGGFISH